MYIKNWLVKNYVNLLKRNRMNKIKKLNLLKKKRMNQTKNLNLLNKKSMNNSE